MAGFKLDEIQLDALREVGNIGAGHATTALAQLIGKKVNIKVPKASLLSVEKIPEIFESTETQIVGIYMRLKGDAKGNCLLAFESDHGLLLANLVLGKAKDDAMNAEKESALKELGNILMGAYLTSLSIFLGLNIRPTIPFMAWDMAGAVLEFLAIDLSQTVEHALVIDIEFALPDQVLSGKVLVFFDPESYMKILKILGVPSKQAKS